MSAVPNAFRSAYDLAATIHDGQVRRFTREPYVEHPARVAATVARTPGAPRHVVVAAYLHDAYEDANPAVWDRQAINAAIADAYPSHWEDVVDLMDTLTRQVGGRERYAAYIARIAGNRWAPLVKRADLLDNMSTLPSGHSLWPRYLAALATLADNGPDPR
jgi:(p)ppGpp synthase/HD superfamily hydrolase